MEKRENGLVARSESGVGGKGFGGKGERTGRGRGLRGRNEIKYI